MGVELVGAVCIMDDMLAIWVEPLGVSTLDAERSLTGREFQKLSEAPLHAKLNSAPGDISWSESGRLGDITSLVEQHRSAGGS